MGRTRIGPPAGASLPSCTEWSALPTTTLPPSPAGSAVTSLTPPRRPLLPHCHQRSRPQNGNALELKLLQAGGTVTRLWPLKRPPKTSASSLMVRSHCQPRLSCPAPKNHEACRQTPRPRWLFVSKAVCAPHLLTQPPTAACCWVMGATGKQEPPRAGL